MTEAEWWSCGDLELMLIALSDLELMYPKEEPRMARKARLFCCACCRHVEDLLPDPDWRRELLVRVERYADGLMTEPQWRTALRPPSEVYLDFGDEYDPRNLVPLAISYSGEDFAADYNDALEIAAKCAAARAYAAYPDASDKSQDVLRSEITQAEVVYQADLLRDIFGNPFRPVTFSTELQTSTANAIAQGMYESRDFSAMPILADALQDAGCENTDILNHLRDPNATHVRGCWALDLFLGKS